MNKHRLKIYGAITVVFAAVILIVLAVFNLMQKPAEPALAPPPEIPVSAGPKNPLNGLPLGENTNLFPVAVMIDNGWDVRPQYGLAQADIIYEALAESNITRLMAVYSSSAKTDKVGPVRSAREYFAQWAAEYQGAYLHVGGSPQALTLLPKLALENVDQIGAGEIYFWRDKTKPAPHNVFTSNNNWLRVGELRGLPKADSVSQSWNFMPATSTNPTDIKDLVINYSDIYKVEWRYSEKTGTYERSQGGDPFVYDSGDQAKADNVVVQIVPSRVVDSLGRRDMNIKKGGAVLIFNKWGVQSGRWENDGRTLFYDDKDEELKLVPGKTWVQVVDSLDLVKY